MTHLLSLSPSSTLAHVTRETGSDDLTLNVPLRSASLLRKLAKLSFIVIIALTASSAHATCSYPYSCVTGFSISPGSIRGDNSQAAIATVQAYMAGYTSPILAITGGVSGASLTMRCGSGG